MPNRPVVLIVTGLFPPEIGGPATYSKILLEELPSRGFDVRILPFSLVRKYPPIIRHLIFSFYIWRQIKVVNIVYAMDPVSVGLPVMLACLLGRRSYWLKIVGDYAWEQGSQRAGVEDSLDVFSTRPKGYGWLVRTLKIVQTLVAKRAQRIVVPSFYLKKIVGNWGVDTEKIDVIYNAFEGKNISFKKEEERSTLGFNKEVIVSVGRLVPWKGFETLIDSMPRLLVKYPQAKLLIVGDGPEEKNLQEKIKQNKLSSSVNLLGRLPQAELFKYVVGADVFVLNTAYEGFSHQLLEVMSLGTPVVTTRIGGNPELIKDGQTGLLFEYNNREEMITAVEKILTDKNLSDHLSAEARQTALGFTRAKMVDGLVDLFKKNANI
ncbi:MAG: glycosyltransferase family 4 protein [Candidatus Paceibacterota bacterium]|jgi:glycosyltransferase involved in cell wall biosynthesis